MKDAWAESAYHMVRAWSWNKSPQEAVLSHITDGIKSHTLWLRLANDHNTTLCCHLTKKQTRSLRRYSERNYLCCADVCVSFLCELLCLPKAFMSGSCMSTKTSILACLISDSSTILQKDWDSGCSEVGFKKEKQEQEYKE